MSLLLLLRAMSSSGLPPKVFGFTNQPFGSLNVAGESLDSSTSPSLIHGIHIFHCHNEVGIVAKVSDCIASRGGNILNADVFVPDRKTSMSVKATRSTEGNNGVAGCIEKLGFVWVEDQFVKISFTGRRGGHPGVFATNRTVSGIATDVSVSNRRQSGRRSSYRVVSAVSGLQGKIPCFGSSEYAS
nr:formyltetrahydrofolate deformylase 1, mitochondrial [Ipomoea batatas]